MFDSNAFDVNAFDVISWDIVDSSTTVSSTTDTLTLTEYQASISNDVNVSGITDVLTLVENVSIIESGSNTNIGAVTDALTLTEYTANITFDVEVITNTHALNLLTNKADVNGSLDNIGGGGKSKKKKREEEYQKAYKRAKLGREKLTLTTQINQQDVKEKKNKQFSDKLTALKANKAIINKIESQESKIDQDLLTELYLNQLEFKRKENESLAILLLIS